MENASVNPPLVTLSIVSHGDSQKIKQLLTSLHQYEHADEFQIIITDNLGNEFLEAEDLKRYALQIIHNKEPLGFACNHNQAFQLATGRYFCVLNPDVIFEQKIFYSLIQLLKNNHADIVAPLVVDTDATPQDSFRSFPTPYEIIQRRLPAYHFNPPPIDSSGLTEPDWIAGIFMFMRSETYRVLNGFDEKYRLYFEDVDFCARAQLAGLKILVDTNIRIQHDAHHASRKNLIYLFWHIQSAFRFFTSPVYKKIKQKSK